MVTEKQKANLKKGKPYKPGEERARINGKKGKIASDQAKAENAEALKIVTLILNAPIIDDKTKAQLDAYGLPKTMLVKTLFNAVQRAGVNPAMLQLILELIGAIKRGQTNVTVNNNTRESPLKGFTKEELMQIAGLTECKKTIRNTSET